MRGQQLHTMSTAELPNHAHMATFTGTGGGGGTPASVAVSETPAKEKVVSAGDYLASDSALGGVSKFVQPADVGTTVPLGGVTGGGGITGGTVTVQGAGNSQSFPVQSPALFVNYSICIAGIYPSRN
jgi:microcystin-dependent protein